MKEDEYTEEEFIDLFDLLVILGQEIADLKEDRCENEGKNWYDKFYNTLNKLREKISPPSQRT